MDFLPLVTALLVANALTAMLIYAVMRMLKMHKDSQFDRVTAACFFTPMGAMVLGLLYLKFA